jgi:hypothetical protein
MIMKDSESIVDKRTLLGKIHAIGHELAVEHKNASIAELFAKCGSSDTLYSGCLHGSVMGLSDYQDSRSLAKQCEQDKFSSRLYNQNCAHGIGHTLVGDEDLKYPLARCGELFDSNLQPDCLSGVFMEYMLGIHKIVMGEAQQDIKIPDCANFITDLRKVCSVSIGSYSLYYSDSNQEYTIGLCNKLQDKDNSIYCLNSAAERLLMAPTIEKNNFCQLLPINQRSIIYLCNSVD